MTTTLCDVCGGPIDLKANDWTVLATKQLIHYSLNNLDCYRRNLKVSAEPAPTNVKDYFSGAQYIVLLAACLSKATSDAQNDFCAQRVSQFNEQGHSAPLSLKQKDWMVNFGGVR